MNEEGVHLQTYYTTLKELHRFYDEQYTSVSPRVRNETIQCLLDIRGTIDTLIEQRTTNALVAKLYYIKEQRQKTLVSLQAFELEYGSLSIDTMLTRKNWIYDKIKRILHGIEEVFEMMHQS